MAIADTGPKLRLLAQIRRLLAELPASSTRDLLAGKLADAEIQLLALCALEEEYVKMWAHGGSKEGPHASILKVRGTEILQLLSEIALEIEGPMGAVHDARDLHRDPDAPVSPAQRASLMAHQYLHGRCWSIFGGTNEVQRDIVARSLLGGQLALLQPGEAAAGGFEFAPDVRLHLGERVLGDLERVGIDVA